jgi:ribosomal protein S18 acetylase RimI-like enzyme
VLEHNGHKAVNANKAFAAEMALPAQRSAISLPLGYAIKAATMRDVHAIRRLEILVFPKDAYSYLNLSALLMWPGSGNYKVVTSSDQLVGFVSGTPNLTSQVDWIVTLGVHPDHQNKGLGRCLLQTAENRLSQPRIRLTVRASNAAAMHLYESAGYIFAYLEPRYYNDGEDGIVLQKSRM